MNSIYFFFIDQGKDAKNKVLFVNPSSLYTKYKSIADSFIHYRHLKVEVIPYQGGKIEKIEDTYSLTKNCMNHNECVILFWPAVNDEYKQKEFDRITRFLSTLQDKPLFDDLKISWVNSTCHGDMLERIEYNKNETPVLVYLWPHRAAYEAFNYSFQEFNLEEFITKGKQQRVMGKRISREQISISNRNCQDPNIEYEDVINDMPKSSNKESSENDNKQQDQKTEEVNSGDEKKTKTDL